MAPPADGRHQPGTGSDAPPPNVALRPARYVARRNLLFLAPLPLLFTAFSEGAVNLLRDLIALALLLTAPWLLGEGLRAEAAWSLRPAARRPRVPRKIIAAALTGSGVALAAAAPGSLLLAPALYGLTATVLHLLAFGPDPLTDKGLAPGEAFQHDRVSRALEGAETALREMRAAVLRTGDRPLIARVDAFQRAARAVFARIEADPRALNAACPYLSVYLTGARDAARRYAELTERAPDSAARRDFAALLDDLEAQFAARSRALLAADREELEIEIGVLRDRLAREGIAPAATATPEDDSR